MFDHVLVKVKTVTTAIVGLRHPVTIAIHILTEISKTSHPRDLKFGLLVGDT